MEERFPFEWEEYPPENPENYRCQECGKRWQDTHVYPDPARKAWACRTCNGASWVYALPGRQIWTNVERRSYRTSMWMRFWTLALAQWLLLGLLFRAFAWNGGDVTASMSDAERARESAAQVARLNVRGLTLQSLDHRHLALEESPRPRVVNARFSSVKGCSIRTAPRFQGARLARLEV